MLFNLVVTNAILLSIVDVNCQTTATNNNSGGKVNTDQYQQQPKALDDLTLTTKTMRDGTIGSRSISNIKRGGKRQPFCQQE